MKALKLVKVEIFISFIVFRSGVGKWQQINWFICRGFEGGVICLEFLPNFLVILFSFLALAKC